MQLSANTSRNIDRLEQNIDRLEQMMGIVIRDNQADRARITKLEDYLPKNELKPLATPTVRLREQTRGCKRFVATCQTSA